MHNVRQDLESTTARTERAETRACNLKLGIRASDIFLNDYLIL